MGGEQSQAYWDKDADHPACRSCKSQFGLFNRRHHCRCCFHIFCDKCTASRGVPVGLPYTEPVRLCASCAGNTRAKRQCNCRPDLAHIRKAVASGGVASAAIGSGGGTSAAPRESGSAGKNAAGGNHNAASDRNKGESPAVANENGGEDKTASQDAAAAWAANQQQAATEEQTARDAEESARRRIDAITRKLNNEIVNLGPFSAADYGLFFSEDPVYGMRIATVVGPVAFALPSPDPANMDGVARLLCSEPTSIPLTLKQLHATPLPMLTVK